jgi:hypothetical protein
MTLSAVMTALKTLEESFVIAAPVAVSLAAKNMRVYKIAPSRAEKLHAMVNFMNWPDAASEQRMGPTREDAYTIQVDCLVDVSDADTAADIALAMYDVALAQFDLQREAGNRLSNTISYLTLRSERPMIEEIMWGGLAYVGFHIFLDLVLFEVSL